MTRYFLPVIVCALVGCSLAPRESCVRSVTSESDVEASYSSFALVRAERVPEPYRRLDFVDGEQAKLEVVAREVLGERGLVEAPPDTAEVVLYLAVGKRRTEGGAMSETGAASFDAMTEAADDTLTLDAFDAGRRHLWHGRTALRVQRGEVAAAEREFIALLASLPVEASSQLVGSGSFGDAVPEVPLVEAEPTESIDEFDEFDEVSGEDAGDGGGVPEDRPSSSGGGSSEEYESEFDGEFDDEF